MSPPDYTLLNERASLLHEKAVVVETLPYPATYRVVQRKRSSCCSRFCSFVLILIATLLAIGFLAHGRIYNSITRGCDRISHQYLAFYEDPGHQHPLPPIDDWKPFEGTTHFELDPAEASGISIKGSQVFGKVVFDTSKLSDKVVIDLDIKTNKKDENGDIVVKEENGFLTIYTPKEGELETHTAVKIQIPSNVIGTFGLPRFQVDAPRHMIDYSELPESLEIGTLAVRVGKGFVKPGPVHTNETIVAVGKGAIRGSLTQARDTTNIDVGRGNVTLTIPTISSGEEGKTFVHLGNGHLKGDFAIYNSTILDVAHGSIYVSASFKHAKPRAEFSTKIASGDSRVYVNSIASERLLRADHTSIAGDQLITYPSNFQGTVDARGIAGDIKLAGKELDVEKVVGGLVGKQGDSERNLVNVKTVKGALDILVGDE
ncbi:hypothetical protein B0A52_06318 [Exophiala mesophila]|uniref:Adhesin domain-containing protein n=1 Tax=Exophiala mesophila TaxID=212818 RepID=A0A438N341_EXOME|nr:hypothetical protein B0A52_06318 [Exophiala mesophila]